MEKLTKAVACTSAGIIALAGCGESATILPERPATVIAHIYDDPDTWIIMAGKVPLVMHDGAHYYLHVEQCDRSGDTHANEQGCVEKTVAVTPDTYNSYPDGSQIVFDK